MIPLALVAGFLGAGKTTLLRRFADRLRGRRVIFLVNEFAGEEVDATLIAEAGGLARAVSGGSVFCVCKADEFRDALAEAARSPGVEGVIVEASGMADPRAMGKILDDPRLAGLFSLIQLVAVTDSVTFPKLVHTLPAVAGQAAEADVILLNKCDLAAPDQVEWAERQLREINPRARLLRAVRAEIDLDPFAAGENAGRRLDGNLAGCGDRAFVSLLVGFDRPVALKAFRKLLDDLGGWAVRVKGWLNTGEGGRLFVEQTTLGGLATQPASEGPSRLVFIVPKNAAPAVRNRLFTEPGARLKIADTSR